MVAALVLIPVAIIGLIAWIAVAVRKSRLEGISGATLTSVYASLLMILSVTLGLLGAAVAVKVILGSINQDWSYGSPLGFLGSGGGQSCSSSNGGSVTCTPIPTPRFDVGPQRNTDIALAIALIVVGAGMFIAHRALQRSALVSGEPVRWVEHGTAVSFAFLYAPAAIFAFVAVVYGVTSFLVSTQSSGSVGTVLGGGPFGDGVGAAAAFIPAWVVAFLRLRRRLVAAPAPPAATPA